MSDIKSVHVVIRGRVQGVYYRGWTELRAERLGIDGWVRNRVDGAVEAVFSGPATAVNALLSECWQGPPAACVEDVAVTPAEPMRERGFTVQS